MDTTGIYGIIAGVGVIVAMIGVAISIGLYIFKSLAIMKYAAARNAEGRWMAWIPVLDVFLMTKATYHGEMEVEQELIKVKLPISLYQFQSAIVILAPFVLGWIPLVGGLVPLLVVVIRVLLFGQVYKDAMLYSGIRISVAEEIICGIFPIVAYVRLFTA